MKQVILRHKGKLFIFFAPLSGVVLLLRQEKDPCLDLQPCEQYQCLNPQFYCGQTLFQSDIRPVSMEDAQKELMETKELIEDTMTALNSLVQADGETLRKQYKKFVKEMANTKKQCEKVQENAKDMDTQGDTFFMAWKQDLGTFENTDIRKRSEERRTASLKSFNKMTGTVQDAINTLESFLKSMDDIQKYLDIDLTSAGISFISTQINQKKENATAVQKAIDNAISEIDRMIGEMPPT